MGLTGEGVVGVITGRAIYEGSLSLVEALALTGGMALAGGEGDAV